MNYLQIDIKLKEVQKEFEALGAELEASKKKGSEQAKIKDKIVALFEEKKEGVMDRHNEFMRLHILLKTIKEKLMQWSASQAS